MSRILVRKVTDPVPSEYEDSITISKPIIPWWVFRWRQVKEYVGFYTRKFIRR